jgi:hypothetical protein
MVLSISNFLILLVVLLGGGLIAVTLALFAFVRLVRKSTS